MSPALEYLKSMVGAAYVFDTEYRQTDGNTPEPVCVTLKNIFTGIYTQHWLLDDKTFPYDIDNSLFICHFAPFLFFLG